MKRIICTMLALLCLGAAVFAQAETAGAGEAGQKKKPAFLQAIQGLSLGVDFGAHEYPLAVWYPGRYRDGYSIRSLFLKPYMTYERTIGDFDINAELDFSVDLKAADPSPFARAENAKDADRRTWLSIYMEEGVAYRLPLAAVPGTLWTYVNHRDNLYIAPDFPGESGALIVDSRLGEYTGRFQWGAGYRQDFGKPGVFGLQLALPVSYLGRADSGMGLGMEMRVGYNDGFGLGLGGEAAFRIDFVPGVRYAVTEFAVKYGWNNFAAELDIMVYGTFTHAAIMPVIKYRFKSCAFKLGVELANVGREASLSPYMGFSWNF
ncbi:MAG: hypothetical protein LBK08_06915 [Treponema sp.]|nr:hypothetical protein [Treponema sp.]